MNSENKITYVENGTNQTLTGNIYTEDRLIYIISGSNVYLFVKVINDGVVSYLSYGVVATLKSGYDLTALQNKLDEEKTANNVELNVLDLLKYSSGVSNVSDDSSVTITIYMTSTIKESPHSNYYYDKSGNKKQCDEGKYVYWRDSMFGGSYKCLSDNKVNAKDVAKSTEDIGGNTYNYYSTSVKVGTVTVASSGTVTVTLD